MDCFYLFFPKLLFWNSVNSFFNISVYFNDLFFVVVCKFLLDKREYRKILTYVKTFLALFLKKILNSYLIGILIKKILFLKSYSCTKKEFISPLKRNM